MLQVTNYNKFRCFEYENEPSPKYQLGDVLFKHYEEGSEIGVVIQTFEDGDFRTDMWGMSSESEVRPADIEDIKLWRPKLMEDLKIG